MSFASVAFITFLALAVLLASVFHKHVVINLALVILWLGVIVVVETTELQGKFWIDSGCTMIVVYEIHQMTKMKGVKGK